MRRNRPPIGETTQTGHEPLPTPRRRNRVIELDLEVPATSEPPRVEQRRPREVRYVEVEPRSSAPATLANVVLFVLAFLIGVPTLLVLVVMLWPS